MAARCTVIRVLLVCLLGAAANVSARDLEGHLDRILFPHEGCPAVLMPGQILNVVAREAGPLVLESAEGTFPIDTKWSGIAGSRVSGRVAIPLDMPVGRYALAWRVAERTDRVLNAVHVVGAVPEEYEVVMVRDPRFDSPEAVTRLFDSLRGADAPVFISGQLLAGERPDIHRALLQALPSFEGTVFIAPEAAAGARETEAFWGPQPFQFLYGPDAYLVWSGAGSFDPNAWVVEELYRLRREAVDTRWAFGFIPDIESRGMLRAYLLLFMDEPLHYRFTADTTRAIGEYPAMRTGALSLRRAGGAPVRLHIGPGAIETLTPADNKKAANP